jgi:hypothetical protein
MKHRGIGEFCTATSTPLKIFCAVRSNGCACWLWYAQILRGHARQAMRAYDFRVRLQPSTREAPAVDHSLKLNVLAVCAVFAFVGAILLGAF